MRRLCPAVLAIVLAACRGPTPPAADAAKTAAQASLPSTPVYVAGRPPASKDVVDAVLASAAVPLRVSPTCANVGTEPTDLTIGRYLAGFLAEMSAADTRNWIETRIEPGASASGDPVWICALTLRHVDGDDRWGWGVQFHVRQRDGLVLADSFTCTGAG
jgi:hypothetical protein